MMKRKQYIKPLSKVSACNIESEILAGSGKNTGTIPVGGTSDQEWFSKDYNSSTSLWDDDEDYAGMSK